MTQSVKGSLHETLVNTIVGWGVNYSMNLFVLPYFGFRGMTPLTALNIGIAFTVVSMARQFVLRRYFNYIESRKNKNV
jgi:hypothetical protein